MSSTIEGAPFRHTVKPEINSVMYLKTVPGATCFLEPAPSAGWRTGPEASAGCIKFGRKPKLSDFQRQEALKRRAAGGTLAEIAKSYAVDSMISRLAVKKA